MTIIGLAFIRELNISSPLSLDRLFLTQQLICKEKIEKYNIILDIFASDTSIAKNLHHSSTWRNNVLATQGPKLLSLDQILVFALFVHPRLIKNDYQQCLGT